jgi:ribosomal protein L16/L10AE
VAAGYVLRNAVGRHGADVQVIFEVEGCTLEIAKEAFHRAHHKLPVGTALIKRESAL